MDKDAYYKQWGAQTIAGVNVRVKLRQVIKGQFYDNSVEGGYDFVDSLEERGYKGNLQDEKDPPYWEFTKTGSPIVVRFYYQRLGGLSLNIVIVKDVSRNQQLLWNRTAPSPQYTDTVKDIIRCTFEGHRPGDSQSFSENKEVE